MAPAEDNPTRDPNPMVETSYRGVRKRPSNRYTVEIRDRLLKRRLCLGTFDNAEDAARAYDDMAIKLRGAKAKTNFPRSAAVIPNRSNTFESSSSTVSSTSFQGVESKKVLELDLNLPPLDLNLLTPLED